MKRQGGTVSVAPAQRRFPVFQAPFDESYAIDLGELENQIEWLFDNGAEGVVFEMVSEVLRLWTSEREELAGKACSLVADRGLVVVSATAESTQAAVALARQAEDVSASAEICTLPVSSPPLDDDSLRHFEQIVTRTSISVVVQLCGLRCPGVTRRPAGAFANR